MFNVFSMTTHNYNCKRKHFLKSAIILKIFRIIDARVC